MGFHLTIDLLRLTVLLFLALEGRFKALFDKPLTNPLDSGRMNIQGTLNRFIDPVFACRSLVGLQEDPGVPLLECR